MTPLPSTEAVAGLPAKLTKWVADIVQAGHKEAAFILGTLGATGVVSLPSNQKVMSALLLAYAAVTHAAERFLSTKV